MTATRGNQRLVNDGHWLIQLSSKWPGIVDERGRAADGSHTFTAADILAEHGRLYSTYGDAVILIDSRVMGKQYTYAKKPAGEVLWVTLYDPRTFSSEADAQAWCDSVFNGLDAQSRKNVCFPRQATPPRKP